MPNNAREEAMNIVVLTRRLSDMNLDFIKEARRTIRDTHEKVKRARQMLKATDQGFAPQGRTARSREASSKTQLRDVGKNPPKIVVVGGSAGSTVGVHAILAALPKIFPAVVFIVQHISPGWSGFSSAQILQGRTSMPVHVCADLQPFHAGRIYICLPNHHLSLEEGLMRIEKSPIENYTRPSVDALFRSAAACYGRRVIGVILSGLQGDGTAGLWQVKKHGGIAIVQEPSEAEFPGMPRNAIENVAVDYVLNANNIGIKLAELVAQRSASDRIADQPRILIVEDETLVARNLRERLKELSYSVCDSVKSGEDAIEAAMEKDPDLILMDIHLAGTMNGIDAARQIRERLQIPVVFITAHADLRTLDQVKTTENYGYLVKPFHTGSIRAAIELALDRREKELRRTG